MIVMTPTRVVRNWLPGLALAAALIPLAGCRAADANRAPEAGAPDACAVALGAPAGGGRLAPEITRLQQEARRSRGAAPAIEKLGWQYVEQARLSYDPGYYKLAEQCALCLEGRAEAGDRHTEAARLLRGYALHNLHRFAEAEGVARKLVAARGLPFDYGLLGDVLMEQGRLGAAVEAYQQMMNLKPGPQAYSRAAHVRWLKGDLAGATQMMKLAARGASPADVESSAWAATRLALYELQAGAFKAARAACDEALALLPEYAPALLARGRVLLAENQPAAAVAPLARAAELNPLPEYQWALADALRASGRGGEARAAEARLVDRGEADDPRTLALYLATRGERAETALRLAEEEIKVRADVFTLDALAWAQRAAGRADEAFGTMKRALAEGTQDARLFAHAGVIAADAGLTAEARRYLGRAAALRAMLLPSEQELLTTRP